MKHHQAFVWAIVLAVSALGGSAWSPSRGPRTILVSQLLRKPKPLRSTSASSTAEVPPITNETLPFDPPVSPATISSPVERPAGSLLNSVQLQSAASVFGGVVLTFALNNHGLGPIVASSLTGLLATMTLSPSLALAAFCGSFAGMARTTVIPTLALSSGLGATCAIVQNVMDRQKWLVGVGGRLGFIAQCACTILFLVLKSVGLAPGAPAALVGQFPAASKLLVPLPMVCLSTVAGALLMSFLKNYMAKHSKKSSFIPQPVSQRLSTAVAAVSLTGLVGGLALPTSIAGPLFCGSFIAMSAPTKLDTYGDLVGASLVGGVVQQLMAGILLGGWGGKLGTAALFGVPGYNALKSLLFKMTMKQSLAPKSA